MEQMIEPRVASDSGIPVPLKPIIRSTTYELNPDAPTEFLDWWETTSWAQEMRRNLKKPAATRNDKYSNPQWTSSNRGAKQWANYGQGAYILDGKPLVFCLVCNGTSQHPRAFAVGTTNLTSHMKSTKCCSSSGGSRETIQDMLTKVGLGRHYLE